MTEQEHPITEHGAELKALHPEMCCRAHLPGTVCTFNDGHPDVPAQGWNLPYEEIEGVEVDLNDAALAGGLSIRSAVIPFPGDHRQYPALVFDYIGAGGARFRPIVLVLDEDHLQSASRTIGNASYAAIEAARKAEGRDPKTGRKTS